MRSVATADATLYRQGTQAHSCREGGTMADAIQWLTDLDSALKKAQTEDKHVLLDFYNPQ
jgi:hypothetical protein